MKGSPGSTPNLQRQGALCYRRQKPEAEDRSKTTGQMKMEWEDALLGSWGEAIPAHPAAYYRRRAARARQVAEETRARAVKERLLDEAHHCDQPAANADRQERIDRVS
jgi:hypothetical protein